MNKKQFVTTGLILTLLGSNIAMGMSYAIKNHHNESLIFDQKQKIQKLEKIKELQSELIEIKSSDIEMLRDKTNEYLTNLDKAIKENSTLKDENTKLKKQLQERKEVSKKKQQLSMELTFYVADCNGCSGITKTGINVKNTIYYKGYRIIATDPKIIPLHSIVKIETKNESYLAYAADTGGAIKGNILDVLVSSKDIAYKYGRQKAKVTIMKEGNS